MKLTQNLILFVFTLFCFNSVSAQYGNGYYNNGYGNGYGRGGGMGMDRSMMAGQGQGSQSKPKEIPAEETAGKIVEQMKPDVNLDDLQAIAITNVLADSLREQGILLKNESSNQEQKIEQIKALRESTDKKISAFLNPDQVEKYKTFMEKLKEGKTGKSKKKKDKESKNKDSKETPENTDTKIQE
ncbi:hypothetical protein HYN56_24335 [Flavobacterium crocinum]|uniref:DUF4890 domain-containing protein n=1 Tax=Flavobacterium crocinum TaxID=2183896 RepID=A0A2S1YSY7_9FLAO|nr:hypothetical protein [Flavobacterium crocinum]AWK07186.1 hypothetical protein HYN56_24335 [Flavobacterium crocinum]